MATETRRRVESARDAGEPMTFPDVPVPGPDGFHHPRSEEEVGSLVRFAREKGLTIRVRGAAHSVHGAIFSDARWDVKRPDPFGLNLMLDRMREVRVDRATKRVSAQAGANLGHDPMDPSGTSTWDNGLFAHLEREKLAFPDTGGIIHQTVAGFLSTGSSGGSLRHSVGDSIVAIRLVDGTGSARELTEAGTPDEFRAVGVSLGLFGVVTAVTFQCVDAYDVIGQESVTSDQDCEMDLFGPGSDGRPSLEEFFRTTEHSRLLWWPQKNFRRVVVWKGRRMEAKDYDQETAPGGVFRPKPYEQFQPTLGSTKLTQRLGGRFFRLIRHWNQKGVLGALTRGFLKPILNTVLGLFVPLDKDTKPQRFWASWKDTLPMDNKASDELLPTRFTEMWIPVSKTAEAMRLLQRHYAENGFAATGPYCCEIYPSKASRFWISPAHEREVVKIDVFWFGDNAGDPVETYYPQFWNVLKPLGYRMHWGKFLPTDLAGSLARSFPKWSEFLAVRERCDPKQVFVTPYWRRHMGIPFPFESARPLDLKELRGVETRVRGAVPDDRLADMLTLLDRHMATEKRLDLGGIMTTLVREPRFVMEYIPIDLPVSWWTRKSWVGRTATEAFYRGFFARFRGLSIEERRVTVTARGLVNTAIVRGRVLFGSIPLSMRLSAVFEWDETEKRFRGERVYLSEDRAIASLEATN